MLKALQQRSGKREARWYGYWLLCQGRGSQALRFRGPIAFSRPRLAAACSSCSSLPSSKQEVKDAPAYPAYPAHPAYQCTYCRTPKYSKFGPPAHPAFFKYEASIPALDAKIKESKRGRYRKYVHRWDLRSVIRFPRLYFPVCTLQNSRACCFHMLLFSRASALCF